MRKPFRFRFSILIVTLTVWTFNQQLILGQESAKQRSADVELGAKLYQNQCADCHGENGEGVDGSYDDPLTGIMTPSELSTYISKTMPEGSPEDCVAEDATVVAKYVYNKFYSIDAQNRLNPPKILFSRLTNEQYRNSVADLVSSFWDRRETAPRKQGLNASYYASRNTSRNKRVLQRLDKQIDFELEGKSPEKVEGKEFAVSWTGCLQADETGEYEIIVRSANSVRLNLNSTQKQLIDARVVSGDRSEYRGKIFLLGGRCYDLQVTWSRHKEDKSFIQLSWIRPGQKEQLIPPQNFFSERCRPLLLPATTFPPDDESYGYPRGINVSREWQDSISKSAIDIAQQVSRRLNLFTRGVKGGDEREKARNFCYEFTRRAFRGKISDQQKATYVDRFFDEKKNDPVEATKRSVLFVLTSPLFLYPDLPNQSTPASRLAAIFWDSIPNRQLLEAQEKGHLTAEAKNDWRLKKLLEDHRTQIKVTHFFEHWFGFDELKSLPKEEKDFNSDLVYDLKTSLQKQINEIVWSDDSDYRKLFTTSNWYVNRKIADFYSAEFPDGENSFEKAKRPDGTSGVLTHPYLMSGFAYPKTSSPIHRGVFLVKHVVGRRMLPPPDVFPPFDSEIAKSWTTREKVAHQTKPVNCQRCHGMINQLGFPLENFDFVGRFRKQDNSKPVDSSGRFITPTGQIKKFNGPTELNQFLVKHDEVRDHFVEQLFQFMVKQPIAAFGSETKQRLVRYFVEKDYNIQLLLVEIGKVAAFHQVSKKPTTSQSKPQIPLP